MALLLCVCVHMFAVCVVCVCLCVYCVVVYIYALQLTLFLTVQIKLCHNLLIDMRGQSMQETESTMARPPMHWKKSCAAILAQTVSVAAY